MKLTANMFVFITNALFFHHNYCTDIKHFQLTASTTCSFKPCINILYNQM